MKKFKALILALIISVSFSFPAFAGELTFPFFCWYDSSGYPLASGKLYSYVSGTSTPKLLYSDKSTTTPHTNPEILDTNGCTEIYGLGTYTLTLKDSTDTTTYFSIDGVVAGGQGGQVSYYYPNYAAADQGATGNSDTIKFAIDDCSTDSCTIYLANNSGSARTEYVLDTDETAGSTIKFIFEEGAEIKPGVGDTLTVASRDHIVAGNRQLIIDMTNNSTNPLLLTEPGSPLPVDLFGTEDDAFIAAVAAINDNPGIILAVGTDYSIKNQVVFTNRIVLDGKNSGIVTFHSDLGTDYGFKFLGPNPYENTKWMSGLREIQIDCNAEYGIHIVDTDANFTVINTMIFHPVIGFKFESDNFWNEQVLFEDVHIRSYLEKGIWIAPNSHVSHSTFRNLATWPGAAHDGHAIYVDGTGGILGTTTFINWAYDMGTNYRTTGFYSDGRTYQVLFKGYEEITHAGEVGPDYGFYFDTNSFGSISLEAAVGRIAFVNKGKVSVSSVDGSIMTNGVYDTFSDGHWAGPRGYKSVESWSRDPVKAGVNWRTPDNDLVIGNDGYVTIPDGSYISVPTHLYTGKWSYEYQFVTAPTLLEEQLRIKPFSGDGNFELEIRGSGGFAFQKYDPPTTTNLFTGSWTIDDEWHTATFTRNSDGDFEVWQDGISKGTATDAYFPDRPSGANINNESGVDVNIRLIDISENFVNPRMGVQSITKTLTAAQVEALATPILIVPAFGADTILEFVSAVLRVNYSGSGNWQEPSAPDELVIEYASGVDVMAEMDVTGFIDQTNDEMRWVLPTEIPTTDLIGSVNDGLYLHNSGGDYTDSDAVTSTLIVTINYIVHATGL